MKVQHNDAEAMACSFFELIDALSGSIKEDTLTISKSFYNPAIFVPELKTVIYGCESWWGRIESEDDLKKLITNETIENVWYMKLLKTFTK